ncbi:hypothetical protein DEU56DRAFT_786832 [Suillus clintonianus]|uniref:uncharacterized protein n=1 Tax=Suillus clintonianus TaxID=1904413 RepID=UPI001B88014D|nr:uncharacterized protein DEU56DRAFT_786832 [Suillus clintonianus]KAG2146204.1 hypothetical protein DEU56DRAFT_786832 [Suillus clintonianus]
MSSPGTIVRNLTFQSNDLGKETTILLVFDANMEGLYDTIYPVVWKVFTFPKTGSGELKVTYTNDLAFAEADVVHGNCIEVYTDFKLKPGQKTTLTLENSEDSENMIFSPPVAGTDGYLSAENKTGRVQDLAVGFFTPKPFGPVQEPALFFKEVEDGSIATAQWKPVLRVYLESNYEETEALIDAIKIPPIWEQDLHRLFRNTTLNLERHPLTGLCTFTKTK